MDGVQLSIGSRIRDADRDVAPLVTLRATVPNGRDSRQRAIFGTLDERLKKTADDVDAEMDHTRRDRPSICATIASEQHFRNAP